MLRLLSALLLAVLVTSVTGVKAFATGVPRTPESDIDPQSFAIDEQSVRGNRVLVDTVLIDEKGREFKVSDMLGQPLVLVMSYYTCDGTCSIINEDLAEQLKGMKRLTLGEDFKVLTVSFDKHDTLETTGAFKRHLATSAELGEGWTFAAFKNPEDIKPFTTRFDFNYYWSPQDRIFYHPGAFVFLSAEGRLIRTLYSKNVEPADVELAILDAKEGQFRPSEIVNYAISLCYSYNYKEGRYGFNIPMLVGAGSLFTGLTLFSGTLLVFRRRLKKGDKK